MKKINEYDLELNLIDCKNYVYISNVDKYHSSNLEFYYFDDKKATKTFNEKWYKLDKTPVSITRKKSNKRVNEQYVLKEGFVPSKIMPKIISINDYNNNLDSYDEIINLYNLKYDEVEDGYETINFNIINIYTRENFEFIENKYNASVDILTEIEYPKEAYQDRPCYVTSEQMFDLIREHVKTNINTDYAKIVSDYDFHFEVEKRVKLATPYQILTDMNRSLRKKPNWINTTISEKSATILNIRNKASSNDYGKDCVIPPSFNGENFKDLQNKIKNYLDSILNEINKNYCECPHCNGWGIIEGGKND